MIRQGGKKLGLIAAAGMMTLALTATPARAHHDNDIVLPVVTAFALGALWQHGHNSHYSGHSYHYKRHSYSRHGYSRHGYSRHGYSHKGHYRRGHGHNRHQYRSSSSRGGYYGSKRKH
jgi:hypothetical protein